jgi:hypothetical protein
MAIYLMTFLSQLATHVATAAELQFAGTPRELWVLSAEETAANCSPIYSVITPYGGETPYVPLDLVSLQVATYAPSKRESMERSLAVRSTLVDASGRPLRAVAVGDAPHQHRILAVTQLQQPSLIGGDDTTLRHKVVFNFDAKVVYLGGAPPPSP